MPAITRRMRPSCLVGGSRRQRCRESATRTDEVHARGLRRIEAVRRRAGRRGRGARGRSRRDHLDHRPERGRQDLASQHDQRLLPARQRRDRVRGQGHTATARRRRRAGHRPHLPEHRSVRRHDGARQHHAGPARADEVGGAVVLPLLGSGPEGGGRAPRPGRGADRISRTAGSAQAADQRRSPTACASGSNWRGRWRSTPRCCSSTSRWAA